MKQLQNNFTTPEQSKRLLELGLPADSADCYWSRYGTMVSWSGITIIGKGATYKSITEPPYHFDFLPCWSVGRLIEIYCICGYKTKGDAVIFAGEPMVEGFIQRIEDYKSLGLIDFSKLEEYVWH